MNLFTLFLIAVGLSMDAFAVSICKGLALQKIKPIHMVIVGIWFGGFQALMPLIGYIVGRQFENVIKSVDHWIAFVLLVLIGLNMIKESLSKDDEPESASLTFKSMFVLSVATSIDALAMGVSFAFLGVSIIPAISFIGVTTFLLSGVGLKIGSIFGTKYKSKAEFSGGVILILMGIKILIEHLLGA